MDKKITIVMIAIIVAVVAIGAFLALSNTFIPESSEYTDLFDYSIEPTTSWNAEIDSTKDGKFELKFTKELSEEPDAFYYDVVSATEV